MDCETLKDRLRMNSPFVLKKKIEKEEQWEFKGDEIVLNKRVIGLYSIEEQSHCFKLRCFTRGYPIKEPILVVIDYKDKPVLLIDPDTEAPDAGINEFDNLLKMIPSHRYLDDEKAEL